MKPSSVKRFKVEIEPGIDIAYGERPAWTLKLVQRALQTLDVRQAALQVPREERVFRTGAIERVTRELDPSEFKVGVNRSTFGKNLDIAKAIAEMRGKPPPTLPDFLASANKWIQPDPDPKTLIKRRSHLFKTYALDELAERKVALGEFLHHLTKRRELLEQYQFEHHDLKDQEYPNPPFRPRETAMELYLYLRTVARKRDLAYEIADLEEQIAVQRAHIQTYDRRYIEHVRKRRKSSRPTKKASEKSMNARADASDVAD